MHRFSRDNDRLTIYDVQPDDEGLYVCRIRDDGAEEGRDLMGGCVIITGKYHTHNIIHVHLYSCICMCMLGTILKPSAHFKAVRTVLKPRTTVSQSSKPAGWVCECLQPILSPFKSLL